MDEGVGARLREARCRRRLGLPEVEAGIKIRARYLRAIESEEWDQLPGDTYARAFIRTYGSFLGLDGERLAEEHRRGSGATRPGERLPRVDPAPRRVAARSRRRGGGGGPRISRRLVTAGVIALVVAALVVIGTSGGGGSGGAETGAQQGTGAQRHHPKAHLQSPRSTPAGHELTLRAKAEVWVCLLNGRRKRLLDGVILAPGEREGPFRSGSFSLALGNGAVTMTVDGKQQSLPEPSSPIGFRIGSSGKVRELPEGERPTCT